MALKKTRIEVNNAVFSLPYHVAKEEGYFAAEGYDVELVPAGSGRDRDKEVPDKPIEDHRLVKSNRASPVSLAGGLPYRFWPIRFESLLSPSTV